MNTTPSVSRLQPNSDTGSLQASSLGSMPQRPQGNGDFAGALSTADGSAAQRDASSADGDAAASGRHLPQKGNHSPRQPESAATPTAASPSVPPSAAHQVPSAEAANAPSAAAPGAAVSPNAAAAAGSVAGPESLASSPTPSAPLALLATPTDALSSKLDAAAAAAAAGTDAAGDAGAAVAGAASPSASHAATTVNAQPTLSEQSLPAGKAWAVEHGSGKTPQQGAEVIAATVVSDSSGAANGGDAPGAAAASPSGSAAASVPAGDLTAQAIAASAANAAATGSAASAAASAAAGSAFAGGAASIDAATGAAPNLAAAAALASQPAAATVVAATMAATAASVAQALTAAVGNAAAGKRTRDESTDAPTSTPAASAGADAAPGVAQLLSPSPAAAKDPVPAPSIQLQASVDSAEFGQSVAERVSLMMDGNLSSAKLQVNPPALGPVEVRIALQAGHAQVWFTSHSAVTRDALESSAPKLREMLGAQGFGQVSVDISQRSFQERTPQPRGYEGSAALQPAAPASILAPPRELSGLLDAYA